MLVVLQGMDTSGKDGTIKHVFRTVNPLGVQRGQLQASQRHRARPRLPVARSRAHAGTRPHHDFQPIALRGCACRPRAQPRAQEAMGPALPPPARLRTHAHRRRHDHPQVLPAHLEGRAEGTAWRSGCRIRRSSGSSSTATSTSASDGTTTRRRTRSHWPRRRPESAPWYIVPSDRKWYRNLVISQTLIDTLESLTMSYPEPTARPRQDQDRLTRAFLEIGASCDTMCPLRRQFRLTQLLRRFGQWRGGGRGPAATRPRPRSPRPARSLVSASSADRRARSRSIWSANSAKSDRILTLSSLTSMNPPCTAANDVAAVGAVGPSPSTCRAHR